jgi:predicted choloylglycine hydrolase
MNENGIGVNPNTLMELQSSTDGLPVAYVIRGILSQEKSEEVVPFIYSVKHASGQNYVIGIRDSVYDFEASANRIVRFYARTEQPGIVYHTNHALVNHDVKTWYLKYHKAVLAGETKDWNSEVRYSTLQKRLGRPVQEVSSEEIKSALRSKDDEKNPVCHTYREGDNVFTFSSVIYTLTGKCSVQVTKGSPDQSEYQEHFFTN